MAQPIKRTVGFAIAGLRESDSGENQEVSLAFSSDSVHLGDPSLDPGSPNPVLITPHFQGQQIGSSVGSEGGGSVGDTRGITEIMRDVRLVAQSGAKPGDRQVTQNNSAGNPHGKQSSGSGSFAFDSAQEIAAPPMGFDTRATQAQSTMALQRQASNASSKGSSGTPVPGGSGDASDAVKAAALAAKEQRKAAHLLEREKAGQTSAPKQQLTRADRRAQQEARMAAKTSGDDAGEDKPIHQSLSKGNSIKKNQSLDKISEVFGGGGAGGGLSSTETNETAATSAARQQQHRLQRQREAKTKTKAASGGCLSDHFSHLRPFQSVGSVFGVSSDNNNINVTGRPRRNSTNATQADNEHPAVAVLARCYQDGSITGGRARCVALLHTLKKVVGAFEVPGDETYAHALTAKINAVVQILQNARPMSVSMGNAVKSLKTHLARMSEEAAAVAIDQPVTSVENDFVALKKKTMAHLEYFEQEKVLKAGRSIVEHGSNEIVDGDVVLTYGQSHHTFEILKESWVVKKTSFKVIVVDSKSTHEGLFQLKKLMKHGVPVAYTTLKGLDYVLRKAGVTKVLLGAAAVLANGAVVSRCGSSLVAATANDARVPVLVAAETCKFHERVQLDAVAWNELGDVDDLVFGLCSARDTHMRRAFRVSKGNSSGVGVAGGKTSPGDAGDGGTLNDPVSMLPGDAKNTTAASNSAAAPIACHANHPSLSVIHLKYDTIPAFLVTKIVCESGAVAPTDVPSFLR